jgi:aryl-alcohol dehydrogenase-like predicted oxidoreductase
VKRPWNTDAGGVGPLFSEWGRAGTDEARRLIDICFDAGVTLFDTADVYSAGESERILGAAIRGRRDRVILSTKMALPIGEGPNDYGSPRSAIAIRSIGFGRMCSS